MKKNSFILLFILVMAILFFTLTIMNNYAKQQEAYCSARYMYNVSEYKKCTKLTQNELMQKLTKEAIESNKLEEVPEVKL